MKRLILTTTGTVAGLAALLSFKSQAHPLTSSAPLPSAAATSSAGSSNATTSSAGSSNATSGAGGASSAATRTGSATSAAPKTYTGQAVTTRYGIVQVRVTVTKGRITDVAFARLTAFDGRSQQINSAAAPRLLQETLAAQSAKVDTVSGASYTSAGYRQSLQAALDEAGLS